MIFTTQRRVSEDDAFFSLCLIIFGRILWAISGTELDVFSNFQSTPHSGRPSEDGKKDEHQVLHSLSSKHVVLLKNLIWHVIAFNETSLEK